MFLAALDVIYFHFCNSLKISTEIWIQFLMQHFEIKNKDFSKLESFQFKGCCNIEIALIQIKWKWCYSLSDIGFFPIFFPIGFFPPYPQGVLLGQNPEADTGGGGPVSASVLKRTKIQRYLFNFNPFFLVDDKIIEISLFLKNQHFFFFQNLPFQAFLV